MIDLDNLAADERAELLAALLAWRDAGEQRPLIPIYGDVDGDGVPDFVGLDSFGGLAVVSGATLADSTAAHDDAGEVDVPELGGPLPVEESEDDEPKPALGPALASAVTLSNTPGTAAAAIRRPFARIDGWPVAIGIVPDLLALKAWFKQATGFNLIVSSGIRTYAEQEAIFRQRYTRTPGGRRVYDVRYWQGVPWYRVSAAGTVAAPGSSNHETGRSLDLRDDGPDPGVASSFNTHRNRLLSANLGRFNFTHTGKNFREPWHVEQLAIADPFLGRGKPHSISPDDPGESINGGGPNAPAGKDDTMAYKEEEGFYGSPQNLGKGKYFPIRLNGTTKKPVHEFAMTGGGQRESGFIIVEVTLAGGPNGDRATGTAGRIRAFFEEKRGGKWHRIGTRKGIKIPALTGEEPFQYSDIYWFGPNVRARVEVEAHHDGLRVLSAGYRKLYAR